MRKEEEDRVRREEGGWLRGDTPTLLPIVNGQIEHATILVWRFPVDISQSRLGGRDSPSHACTLIAIRLAELIHRNGVLLPDVRFDRNERKLAGVDLDDGYRTDENDEEFVWMEDKENFVEMTNKEGDELDNISCPHPLTQVLVHSILDGNVLHTQLMEAGRKELNFTIPDAINATGNNFQEIDFHTYKCNIAHYLPKILQHSVKSPLLSSLDHVFFLAIAYERTVLFIYERISRVFLLVDTHLHSNRGYAGLEASEAKTWMGSVLATCQEANLAEFGHWIAFNVFPETQLKVRSEEFEISVLDFCGLPHEADCVRMPHVRFNIKCEGSEENCYCLPRYYNYQSVGSISANQQLSLSTSALPQLKRPASSDMGTSRKKSRFVRG